MINVSRYKIEKFFKSSLIHIFLMTVAASCLFPLLWMVGSALKTQETVFSDMSIKSYVDQFLPCMDKGRIWDVFF